LNQQGQREERDVVAPAVTLKNVRITEYDLADLTGLDPFPLGVDAIQKYEIAYIGRERVDDVDTYVFDVRPKTPPDPTRMRDRYFEGRVWVDTVDLAIVKLQGRSLPEDANNKFPRFETYRENIDKRIWFPTYIHADDVLRFPKNEVHVRLTVRYTNFKRFKGGAPSSQVTQAAPGSEANESSNRGRSTTTSELTLDQIKELIAVHAPDALVSRTIRDRRINFEPTEKLIEELKRLGAGPETVEVLRALLPPNRAPSVVLKIDRDEVLQGESVALIAEADDPDDDDLTYDWSPKDGTIEGNGPKVTLNTSRITVHALPVRVRIMITVNDRKGGTDSDSASVVVRPPKNSPCPPSQQFFHAVSKLEVKPKYPDSARRLGITGTVIVEVMVNEQGWVALARVISGPDALHQASLDAAKEWRYFPARCGDQAVRETTTMQFEFRPNR
jgi:TonB family protein